MRTDKERDELRRATLPAPAPRPEADDRTPRESRPINGEHICARYAICFQCFRAGVERVRARREAWLQRTLPFEAAAPRLTPREIAHRQRMLDHLAEIARRA